MGVEFHRLSLRLAIKTALIEKKLLGLDKSRCTLCVLPNRN